MPKCQIIQPVDEAEDDADKDVLQGLGCNTIGLYQVRPPRKTPVLLRARPREELCKDKTQTETDNVTQDQDPAAVTERDVSEHQGERTVQRRTRDRGDV